MAVSSLNTNNKRELDQAIKAFKRVRDMSEQDLETLEILADENSRDTLLKSLNESAADKVEPIDSIR